MPANKLDRSRRNCVEYRPKLRWRAGDHLQDVGSRGLPLQRLLRLVEQPRVLDGDHGLMSEGLHETDRVLVETTGLYARDIDRADCRAAVQHGDHQKAPIAANAS